MRIVSKTDAIEAVAEFAREHAEAMNGTDRACEYEAIALVLEHLLLDDHGKLNDACVVILGARAARKWKVSR